MNLKSLIPMRTVDVIRRCTTALSIIGCERMARDEAFVKKTLAKWNNRWWRKLLRLEPLTSEYVEEWAYHEPCSYPSGYGGIDLGVIESMLRTAKDATGDIVYISPDDWASIRRYV